MSINFWQNLPKPFFALAPMENVTDLAFREIFAMHGKPDVSFTEFINVDGLTHPVGFEHLKRDLQYTEKQRPIVAQIWGRDPEKFYKAAGIVASLGFNGVDINMGCPQDKEISQKTCAALILEPALAGEIIQAAMEGSKGLPVSVKTRLGYSKPNEMEGWVSHLLKYPIAALTLHARTKQEKSAVPAHWEKIKEAVEIRDQLYSLNKKRTHKTLSVSPFASKGETSPPKGEKNTVGLRPLIIGNGDVKSREEGLERIQQTGCDGIMVGRGAFGNPWLFRPDGYIPAVKERLSVMLEHAEMFEKFFAGQKSFAVMRQNFKAYASGFEGAAELRAKLMETENLSEVLKLVADFAPEHVEGQNQ